MKLLFIILISVILLSSCKDPSSLDATREKIKIYDPNDLPAVFKVIPDTIDLGIIHPGKLYSGNFSIENISNNIVKIESISATINKNQYLFGDNTIINLNKKGEQGASRIVNYSFISDKPGNFDDIINWDSYKNPKTPLITKVASVWAEDIQFNNTKVGEFDLKILKINNNSDVEVSITDFLISDPDGVIINEPQVSIPLIIKPNSVTSDIFLTFRPKDTKEYNSKITIKAIYPDNSKHYTDEIINIVGRGRN